MDQLFKFDKMITPTIIKIVFFIGTALFVIVGIGIMVIKLPMAFLLGLLVMAGGILITRIYCEVLIVIFKILTSLQNIEEQITGTDRGNELNMEL